MSVWLRRILLYKSKAGEKENIEVRHGDGAAFGKVNHHAGGGLLGVKSQRLAK